MSATSKDFISIDLEKLTGKLKAEDSNYSKVCRVLQIIYWIFVPLYLLMALYDYSDTGEVEPVVRGISMSIAFVIFAIFFGKYYKTYRYVDYSLSTLTMLKRAAYRYQPFQWKMLWIVLAIFLMNTGMNYNSLGTDESLLAQVVFLGAILIGFIAGLLLWYIKYRPLRNAILRLIDEIENN